MSATIDLIERARDDAEAIAVYLLGAPNKALSNNRELRWGDGGKVSMARMGAHKGKWRDWSDNDRHGDALDLIEAELSLDRAGALEWLQAKWFQGAADPIDYAARAASDAAAIEEERQQRLARVQAAADLWRASTAFAGSLAQKYLEGRLCGFPVPPAVIDGGALRYFVGGHKDFPGSVGCMVALMTDPVTAKPSGVHRTFLDAAGVKLGRKMLGTKGVVRLWPDDAVTLGLSIGEGIETTLAGHLLFDSAPAWAALDAGNLAAFPVLGGIETLEIFADNDPEKRGRKAGQDAAQECAGRWLDAGREVISRVPKTTERDFANTLETLTGKGAAA